MSYPPSGLVEKFLNRICDAVYVCGDCGNTVQAKDVGVFQVLVMGILGNEFPPVKCSCVAEKWSR